MMKTMKKLMALVMVIAIVMTMAITVSADAVTGTINVQNMQSGKTYTAYKIFDLDYNTTTGEYGYLLQSGWDTLKTYKTDLDADGTEEAITTYFDFKTVNDKTFVTAKFNANSSEAAIAAKLINAYVTANPTLVTGAVAVDGVISNLAEGYYLMTSDLGSLCALGTLVRATPDAATATLTLREKNTESSLPIVEKTIVSDGTNTSYEVGETISFKVVIQAEEGITRYTVHDLMDGMSFNNDVVVKVQEDISSDDMVVQTKDEDYVVRTTGLDCTSGCTFEVVIDFDPATVAYQKVEITYSATVTADYVDGMSNEAWIDEKSDTVTVEKVELKFQKVIAGTTTQLEGAYFELYMPDQTTQIPVVSVKDADGNVLYYRPAGVGETAETMVAGNVTIKGLDKLSEGNFYYLKETQAPAGYSMIDGLIQITAVDQSEPQKIDNQPIDPLPETGGMGTTLFYVMGGVMVVAALVLLVTKKRMAA